METKIYISFWITLNLFYLISFIIKLVINYFKLKKTNTYANYNFYNTSKKYLTTYKAELGDQLMACAWIMLLIGFVTYYISTLL